MLAEFLGEMYGKRMETCTDQELYAALVQMTNELAAKRVVDHSQEAHAPNERDRKSVV